MAAFVTFWPFQRLNTLQRQETLELLNEVCMPKKYVCCEPGNIAKLQVILLNWTVSPYWNT